MAWQVNWQKSRSTAVKHYYWARNKDSLRKSSRAWHWVKGSYLRSIGVPVPRATANDGWEVDWSHAENTGAKVWARNTRGHLPSSRAWHLVSTGYLRNCGIKTPRYRKDSWEIDWSKRDGKKVWARNEHSKMPKAREWHWINYHTVQSSGLKWKPKREKTGRYVDGNGYINLTRPGMTEAEVELATKLDLFRGARKTFVREHQLVAAQKYGSIAGFVIRHLNGIKADNRPENLVRGTTQENTMDHNTARLQAMYWREQYEILAAKLENIA